MRLGKIVAQSDRVERMLDPVLHLVLPRQRHA